jgi:hypothetical protein
MDNALSLDRLLSHGKYHRLTHARRLDRDGWSRSRHNPDGWISATAAMEVGIVDTVTGLLSLLLLLLLSPWLLTRLSLFAPALSRERLSPLAALKRSNELARGHFWLVF